MNKSLLMLIIVGTIAATITALNTSVVFAEKIEGTDGNDILFGTNDDDHIATGDGNDEASGQTGDDNLKTGDGDDNNFGGPGDDKLNSGDGDDFLQGSIGADKYKCGSGLDRVAGFDETEGDKAQKDCEQFVE